MIKSLKLPSLKIWFIILLAIMGAILIFISFESLAVASYWKKYYDGKSTTDNQDKFFNGWLYGFNIAKIAKA